MERSALEQAPLQIKTKQSANHAARGEKVRELFTMCCTAGLGAKEERMEGSGGGDSGCAERTDGCNLHVVVLVNGPTDGWSG